MTVTRKDSLGRKRTRRATGVIALSLTVLLAVMIGLGGVLLWSSGAHAQQSNNANASQVPDHQPSDRLSESDIARMLPSTNMGCRRIGARRHARERV